MKKQIKEEVIKVDENGNPIDTGDKKKINWKELGKKAVKAACYTAIGVCAGIATFVMVGMAMNGISDDTSEGTTIDVGDSTITFTPKDTTEPVSNGGTEE